MTVAETVSRKVQGLALDRQIEVLKFVETIEHRDTSAQPLRDPQGLLSDLASDVTPDDFADVRRELSAGFPREFLND